MARDLWPLTAQQADVMKMLAVDGLTYAEINAKLGLSHNTVSARVKRAIARLGCKTMPQAIRKLAERGYFKE